MKFVDVAKPDWLKLAVDSHISTLELLSGNTIPEPLIGTFVLTMCLRFLRAVFGCDDVEAAKMLVQYTIAKKDTMDRIFDGN